MRSIDSLQSACLCRENSSPVRNQMGSAPNIEDRPQGKAEKHSLWCALNSGVILQPLRAEKCPTRVFQIANSWSDDCFYHLSYFLSKSLSSSSMVSRFYSPREVSIPFNFHCCICFAVSLQQVVLQRKD